MLGFEFQGNYQNTKKCLIYNEEVSYIVHRYFPFDSDRKRASVIVEMPDGTIKHFIKGADSVILSRLYDEGTNYYDINTKYIDKFSTVGFRCLLFAVKVYTNEEIDEIHDRFNKAEESENREEAIVALENEIENNFY